MKSLKKAITFALSLMMLLSVVPPASAVAAGEEHEMTILLPGYMWDENIGTGTDYDLLPVKNQTGNYGFVNGSGEVVIPLEYEAVFAFSEGLAAVRKDEKWGFIDKTGKMVIQPEYSTARSFVQGLAAVSKTDSSGNTKYGFIDTAGKVVVELKYDAVHDFQDGMACVMELVGQTYEEMYYKYGFVDQTGKLVIPMDYEILETGYMLGFSEGMAQVTKLPEKDLSGGEDFASCYIDKTGKVVVPLQYRFNAEGYMGTVEGFQNGFAVVCSYDDEGLYGVVNEKGEEVIPLEYSELQNFSEGLAAAQKDGKYGFIDQSNQVVIPMQYDRCLSFSEGLAMVEKDGKCGYIDKTGKIIIPLEYDIAYSFTDGYARVQKTGQEQAGLIDKTGQVIIPLEHRRAAALPNGQLFVDKGYEWWFYHQEASVAGPSTAIPNPFPVLVDGKSISMEAYNIEGNTYFKLRDLAYVFNGTAAQFNVSWDGAANTIVLTNNQPYTAAGDELNASGTVQKSADLSQSAVTLDGNKVEVTAYIIDGSSFFKLGDLGKILDFSVTWDSAANTIKIES